MARTLDIAKQLEGALVLLDALGRRQLQAMPDQAQVHTPPILMGAWSQVRAVHDEPLGAPKGVRIVRRDLHYV